MFQPPRILVDALNRALLILALRGRRKNSRTAVVMVKKRWFSCARRARLAENSRNTASRMHAASTPVQIRRGTVP